MLNFYKSIGFKLFLFTFSILVFFSPGFIEAEDSWLYISVSKNIYYNHSIESAPNEYSERKNVNFNSLKNEDGSWRAYGSTGYSILMVPAVMFSDIYHKITNTPVSQHFPLETDWSLHLAAGFMHAFWGSLLVVLFYSYMGLLGFSKKHSLFSAFGIFFLSNLFPLTGDSFSHILFIDFLIMTMIFIRKFSINKNYLYLVAGVISFLIFSIIYNITYAFLIPGLLLYFYLLNKDLFHKLNKKIIVTSILGVIIIFWSLLIYFYKDSLFYLIKTFRPTYIFESAWGLLFSSGKSIFLYNPLLILIPLYWHKISKKYLPEIALTATTFLIYLFFISQGAIFFQGTNIVSPIWHGGLNWGTRYLSPVIALAMILVFIIIKKLSLKQKIYIVLPIAILALYVQLLGVLLPYQIQYKNTPDEIIVGDQRIDRYNFTSHIPRFSPIIVQSKELIKRIVQFPSTVNNGVNDVKFYDGFDAPYYTPVGTFRGFKDEGHVSLDYPARSDVELAATFYYASTPESSSSASISLSFNEGESEELLMMANEDFSYKESIPVMSGENKLSLLVDYENENKNDTIFIKSMSLDGINVNLGSLDMPYVDVGTKKITGRKYYGIKTNDWDSWYMRSAIYENTFDLWWIRDFYYWDLPHNLSLAILVMDLSVFIYTSNSLYKYFYKNK